MGLFAFFESCWAFLVVENKFQKLSWDLLIYTVNFGFKSIVLSFCWVRFKTDLGSTHVVEQLLFSMCPLVTTFDFDLIFGLGLTFWLFNKLFFGSVYGSKTVLRSTHVAEQFLIFRFSSILTFEFDLILGSFWTFWSPNGLFSVSW